MRFVSYNIQIPAAKTLTHPWEGRKEALLNELPELGDVIGLQEVDYTTSQGAEVSERLHVSGFDGFEPAFNKTPAYDDTFHYRNPVFWKKDLFGLQTSEVTRLTTGTVEEQLILPNIEARYMTYVKLEHVNGKSVNVFNLHQQHVPLELTDRRLIAGYQAVQQKSLQAVEKFVNRCKGLCIVFGDFNMTNPTLSGFSNTTEAALTKFNSSVNTYHGYCFKEAEKGDYIIDHVFVNQPELVKQHELLTEYKNSDHYPLRISLKDTVFQQDKESV